jgi:putative tricarboxylic transport membrane protein
MSGLERGACLFLMGFSILFGVMSLKLGIGGLNLLGRGLMPFLSSIVLFVLSLIVLIGGVSKGKGREVTIGRLGAQELAKPILFVGGLVAYAFFLVRLGYLVMTFGLVFLLFFMMQPKKWRMDLFFAALVSVLSFLLFDVVLRVRLPAGILTGLR